MGHDGFPRDTVLDTELFGNTVIGVHEGGLSSGKTSGGFTAVGAGRYDTLITARIIIIDSVSSKESEGFVGNGAGWSGDS